jgi:hypothetical protein
MQIIIYSVGPTLRTELRESVDEPCGLAMRLTRDCDELEISCGESRGLHRPEIGHHGLSVCRGKRIGEW